jgi:DNA-binding transcriptional ArsR family regulator/uncharacterized protein YndB with AHSA1/START domain
MAAYSRERSTDPVFRALADPSRRRLLDSLNARNGQTLRELCAGLDMARQSVSKHLRVLEEAGLVTTAKRGREKLHHLDAAPINAIADRWISRYDRERARALADLTTALEARSMTAPQFVYTTYIRTTPEQLWDALTNPEFTRRYWGAELLSDWHEGSTVAWRQFNVMIEDPAQVVVEADPPRRLAYTFHTFTPEFVEVAGFADDVAERVMAERRSTVTFEIEPLGEKVKLTVRHDGFEPGSTVLELISGGWPAILSNLKTLLETGAALPPETLRAR